MPSPPNKAEVEHLVEQFAKVSRQHVRDRMAAATHLSEVPGCAPPGTLDEAIDEVIASAAIFSAMSVSKVPTDKVRRLDDFNASFRAQLAAEIVSGFKPFTL